MRAALFLLLAGCAGGVGAWTAADTRKASDVVRAMNSELALCSEDDGGACRPSHVRALGEVARCKAASMLYAHGQTIPEDGGGGCSR